MATGDYFLIVVVILAAILTLYTVVIYAFQKPQAGVRISRKSSTGPSTLHIAKQQPKCPSISTPRSPPPCSPSPKTRPTQPVTLKTSKPSIQSSSQKLKTPTSTPRKVSVAGGAATARRVAAAREELERKREVEQRELGKAIGKKMFWMAVRHTVAGMVLPGLGNLAVAGWDAVEALNVVSARPVKSSCSERVVILTLR